MKRVLRVVCKLTVVEETTLDCPEHLTHDEAKKWADRKAEEIYNREGNRTWTLVEDYLSGMQAQLLANDGTVLLEIDR